jgi:hypothetical protein
MSSNIVVLGPLTYAVFVPAYIQSIINKLGSPGKDLYIHKLGLGEMNDNEVHFSGDFRTPALSPFPVFGGFKPFQMKLVQKTGGGDVELAQVELPDEVAMWFNKEVKLAVTGKAFLTADNIANTKKLLKQLSTPEGVKGLSLSVRFAPEITAFGMTAYKSLPLYRDVDIGDFKASTTFLLDLLKSTGDVESGIHLVGPEGDSGAALRANFNENDIMTLPDSLGGLQLVWNSLVIPMDDVSAGMALTAAFENPSPLELTQIDQIDFFLELEGVKAMKVTIKKVGLASGLNKDFNFEINLGFIAEGIDYKAVQTAIETAAKHFSEDLDFEFAIVGPIKISGANFVNQITEEFRLLGKASDLMSLLPKQILDILNGEGSILTPETFDQVQSILGESKISLSVTSDTMRGNFGLKLPVLGFLKPPKSLKFPYQTTLSLFGNSQKVLQTDVSPIDIVRQSDGGVLIQTEGVLKPENSDAAATALANAINPMLAVNPTVIFV